MGHKSIHYVCDFSGNVVAIVGAPSMAAAARWAWPAFDSRRLLAWEPGRLQYRLIRFSEDGDITSREVSGLIANLGVYGVEWADFKSSKPVVVAVEQWVSPVRTP